MIGFLITFLIIAILLGAVAMAQPDVEVKKVELGKAVPAEWFATKEAQERKKRIEESTEELSEAMKASLRVSPELLKSFIGKAIHG
jgi:hypothetical protein